MRNIKKSILYHLEFVGEDWCLGKWDWENRILENGGGVAEGIISYDQILYQGVGKLGGDYQ
jgi:hypothetical protein